MLNSLNVNIKAFTVYARPQSTTSFANCFNFVAETTQTYALATTTKHVSRGNTNGDLASSDTAISEDKEESDTDPQFILKHVSSQLSSLSFNFSHEINKLKDIVDNALQVYTESSTLLSRGRFSI